MVRCLYCGEYLPIDNERTELINDRSSRRQDSRSYDGSEATYRIPAAGALPYVPVKPRQKGSQGIDLSIFHPDGSLNWFKCLALFALIDGLLLLIMLNILLMML